MQNTPVPPLEDRELTTEEKRAVIWRADELLELTYRSSDLGNYQDPLDEAIYIILSRQTRESSYQRTYAELKARWPDWSAVAAAAPGELEEVISSAGFGKQRAQQLQALLREVTGACAARGLRGQITLDWLHDLDDEAAESYLLTLPGIGPKSARCIMHYALGRDAFAVDTHVRRIFDRLSLVQDRGGKVKHEEYESLVPSSVRQRLHVNLIHHGRAICRTSSPSCDTCVLVSFCRTGRSSAPDNSGPVAVELFAGAGGLGTGFMREGFKIAAAVEVESRAAQTYRLNHPGTVVIEADARNITGHVLSTLAPAAAKPTALIAGPPCQGYSVAGKREPGDEKNGLFLEVTRLAEELKPQFVAIENVPGMRGVGGVRFTTAVLDELDRVGYSAEEYLLRACDFGVPQLRHRVVFLAQRRGKGGAPPAPQPTHCAHWACVSCAKAGEACDLPPTPSVLEVLSGLPLLGVGEFAEYRVEDGRVITNASTMAHSDSVVRKISSIEPGKGPISYRRLHKEMARTVVAGHRALPVHPTLDRTISVREAARIQGFPDTYTFCGPRGAQPLQVANAVPPPMAAAIARELVTHLEHADGGKPSAQRTSYDCAPIAAS